MYVHEDALQEAAAAAMLEEYPDQTVEDNLDGAAQDMEEDSEALGEISRNAVDQALVAESMESYMTKFFDSVPAGEWNGKIARQYQLGMTGMLAANGLSIPAKVYAASFESAAVNETNEENEASTKDKSAGLLKRIGQSVMKAIKAVLQALTNFVKRIGKTAKDIKAAAVNLKAKAQAARGKKASQTTFTDKPVWGRYLSQGGSTKTATDVLNFLDTDVTLFITNWLATYASAGVMIQDAATKGQAIPASLASEFNSGMKSVKGDWPGYKVVIDVKDGADVIDTMTAVGVTVTKENVIPASIPVLSAEDVIAVGTRMDAASASVEKSEKAMNDAISILNRINGQLSTWGSKPENADKFSDEIKAMPKIISKLSEVPRKIFPVVADIVSCGYKHCDASLKLMGVGPTKPEGDDKADDKADDDKKAA